MPGCPDTRSVNVTTGGGGDGVAALALAPFFGLAEVGVVELGLDRILLHKGLFIGSAGLPVIAYLGGI
jgi:hypothetical protein